MGRIYSIVIVSAIIFTFGSLCNASEKLSQEVLRKVSALTVLVKSKTKLGIIPATGFIFKQTGDDVYILSKGNIFPDDPKVKITFYSGSSKEKTLPGDLICYSDRHNIAVIKVHAPFFKEPGFKESSAKFHRTMQLYIVRFDFGLKPAGSSKGPSPSFIPSGIAALHKNPDGSLKSIRLDAEVSQKNAQTPVVDAEGNLVGLLHIGLRGTRMTGILLFKDFNKILKGNIEKISFGKLFKDHENFKLEITTRKFDPFNSISGFGVLVMPQSMLPRKPRMKNNEFQPIAEPDAFKNLPVTNEAKQILIDLGKIKEKTVLLAIQFQITDSRGKVNYSPISNYQFYARDARTPASRRKENKPDEYINPDDSSSPPTPIPSVVNKSIIGKKFDIKDAEINRLKLQYSENLSLFWGHDRKSFYSLDEKNVLRKISYPALVEQARIEFNRKVSSCALSQCGIVAVCPELNELWLINKDSLAVEKQIKINDGFDVESTPELKLAFVTGKSSTKRYLAIIDLEKGKQTGRIDAHFLDPMHFSINFDNFSVSHDGKFLFANSGSSFCSFRIAERYVFGWTIVPHKVSSKSLGYSRIVLSRDNLYFALPQVGKIFQMSNLNAPLLEITPGKTLSFDKKHSRLISSCNTYDLRIYDAQNGKVLKTYSFKDIDKKRKHVNIAIEKMLFDPDHDTLIAYSYSSLYKIKLLNVPKGTPAQENWVGSAPNVNTPLEKGKAVKRVVPLTGKTSGGTDMKIKYFTFENKLVPQIIWSQDRRCIYIADAKGMIRKITYPGFVQEYVVDLADDLTNIKLSKSHLVAVSASGTVYTLSPIDLKLTRARELPLEGLLTVSPASDFAYSGSYHDMSIVDLNTLKIVNTITTSQIAKLYGDSVKVHSSVTPGYLTPDFINMTITSDGKYLLCGGFHIYKFKTIGKTVKYLEVGPPGISEINISQDNRHVILSYSRGLPEYIDKPAGALPKSALIYKIDDLAKPVAYINADDISHSQMIYNSDRNINYILSHQLYSYSKKGYLVKKYNLNLDAIEAVPEKQELLATGGKKLYLISFTNKVNTPPASVTVPENRGLQLYKKRPVIADGIQCTLFITPGAWIKTSDVKWIDNGKACIISGSNREGSVIYELAFPGLKEKRRLLLGDSIRCNLSASGEGMLVEAKKSPEFWLLNTGDLSISARIPDRNCKEIAVAPGSTIAFLLKDAYPSDQLIAFDLKHKKVLYQKEIDKLESKFTDYVPLKDVDNIFMTPNGKYLICENSQSLYRYVIGQNARLAYSGAIKKEKYSYLLTISDDSRYLVIKKNKSVEIRKVSDLNKIVLELPVDAARSVGFDMRAGRLYVVDGRGKLLVFDSKGNLLKTFRLRIGISRIYVNPDGSGKMLGITSSSSLYWLEMLADEKAK
jgi:hypothetical protein